MWRLCDAMVQGCPLPATLGRKTAGQVYVYAERLRRSSPATFPAQLCLGHERFSFCRFFFPPLILLISFSFFLCRRPLSSVSVLTSVSLTTSVSNHHELIITSQRCGRS